MVHPPVAQPFTSPQTPERALARALGFSPFLARLAAHAPPDWRTDHVAEPFTEATLTALLTGPTPTDEAQLWRQLRLARQHAFLRIAGRDLSGLADLPEVLQAITVLADGSVRHALAWLDTAMRQTYGTPIGEDSGTAQTLIVVGMGKLGGEELNVSSDIDLIFVYPEEGATDGTRSISNHEYFTRLGRRLIAALSEVTADGAVFRVDMRLRPYGDNGPLVASLSMLENYFHSQGREWERYAWLKARAITGKQEELRQQITPFVFRRHLDYSAIDSLRALHAQIRQEVRRKEIAGNIKLGPGGIREIEFIAQVFQLIRGGQDSTLRTRSTREALRLLAEKRLLPWQAVESLWHAYAFLRNLEHRLQYAEDQQTQTLPTDPFQLDRLSRAMGYADSSSFSAALSAHTDCVSRHFEGIFAAERERDQRHPQADVWEQPLAAEDGSRQLTDLGYADSAQILRCIHALREGSLFRRMSATTQARIDNLGPRLLAACASQPNADATFERLLTLLESIGRREAYLALLQEYAGARDRLVRLASASPWAATYLAQHPMLLDELVTDRPPEPPDWTALAQDLEAQLDQRSDAVDRQMDLLRHFKHVQTFRLLIQDLNDQLLLETLSDHLSDLAVILLRSVLQRCWLQVKDRPTPTPHFAIIGYGKLGGKELGYASDLDLIFLYAAEPGEDPQPFTRLAQRINTWLGTLTSAGVLYEIDLRLRPDGDSGTLVSHVDAFEQYQLDKAWVFEHQAITRARFVAGDAAIGARFEALRARILTQARDRDALRNDIASMRQRMLEGHPNKSGLFDIKHDRGGIVDVEFIVQYLVLGYSNAYNELTANIGNLALLKLAARLGLIPSDLADAVHHSYREFRRIQHALRLQGERYARIDRSVHQPLISSVAALWSHVF